MLFASVRYSDAGGVGDGVCALLHLGNGEGSSRCGETVRQNAAMWGGKSK